VSSSQKYKEKYKLRSEMEHVKRKMNEKKRGEKD
jgi:hypothetical protein